MSVPLSPVPGAASRAAARVARRPLYNLVNQIIIYRMRSCYVVLYLLSPVSQRLGASAPRPTAARAGFEPTQAFVCLRACAPAPGYAAKLACSRNFSALMCPLLEMPRSLSIPPNSSSVRGLPPDLQKMRRSSAAEMRPSPSVLKSSNAMSTCSGAREREWCRCEGGPGGCHTRLEASRGNGSQEPRWHRSTHRW